MRILRASDSAAIARLAVMDHSVDPRVRRQAARIVHDVEHRGDAALRMWRRRLDRDGEPLEVTRRELRAGWRATPPAVRLAIRRAIGHVERVAVAQRPRPFAVSICPGVRVEQRVVPLTRVGCYVPGGRYPLPSTVVMTAVPARVAGVREVIVCCPAPAPAVLCAALEAGATRVFRMGGAQAIAALAHGTRSVPRVDKIVGPGNAWVAAAKDLVAAEGRCAVDMHAGPSEIVILSDDGPAGWIAADLIAQAEHDPSARAIFVTTRPALALAVRTAVTEQTPASGPARDALRTHGAIVLAGTRRQAREVVARLSPEHLVVDQPGDIGPCGAAGTVFVGRWSAQAAGDYCTGSNHVLPTGGAARFRGGLGAADFVRVFTVQRLTRRGLRALAPVVDILARAEGLDAHAASIRIRTGAQG